MNETDVPQGKNAYKFQLLQALADQAVLDSIGADPATFGLTDGEATEVRGRVAQSLRTMAQRTPW